jgi:hypothetical protein
MKKIFTLMLSVAATFLSYTGFANQITVCASGCGYTTIQSAVNAAASGDTILINVNGAITESGISITKNLTIRGMGQNVTIVQGHAVRGSAIHRIFYINGSITVIIENLAIQHGKETADPTAWNGSGCGMLIDGAATVTLNSVTVKNNDNIASGGAGAGISLGSTASINLNNCRVEGNRATTNMQSSAGLYLSSSGSCTAKYTVFNDNIADQSGGAVFLGGSIIATFVNCTFSNNSSTSSAGGAMYGNSALPTFVNCTFNNNAALTQGGALRCGPASLTNCTFFQNTAATGAAIYRGGGNTSPLTIVNTTIAYNTASASGGGLYYTSPGGSIVMANSVFASNTAPAGVDMYVSNATLITTNQKNYVGSATFGSGSTAFAYTSGANLPSSLTANGGLTNTIAVPAGSVLINNGAASVGGVTIPQKDQRNYSYSGTLDIGAYEYSATDNLSLSYTTLGNTTGATDRTLSVTITDNIGIPTSGSFLPRIYYKKNAGAWVSTAATLSSGTALNGTWTFTINNNLIGGVANNDVISYFVTAQDNTTGGYGKSNLSGLVAGNVNAVGTAPSSPDSYTVSLITLPVKLISFDAVKSGDKILVSWKAEENGDADHYELLKSIDGINYSVVIAVTPNTSGVYSFEDNNPSASNYYKLKIAERSGGVNYSKIVKLQFDKNNHWSVSLQSNLITGNALIVKTTGMTVNINYDVVDMSGQVITKGILVVAGFASETINLKSISAGKYFLRVIAPGEKPVVLPFVKQ